MVNTPATRRLLREQRIDDLMDLVRTSTAAGMVSFSEALLQLFRAGLITYETGLGFATNPEEFTLWTKGMTTGVQGARGTRDAPATRGLDLKVLLGRALELGASDLHLAAGRAPMVRIVGSLRRLGEHVLTDADLRMLLHSIMTNRQREVYELEREVDFAIGLEDGRRFRVNAYFQRGRMAAALRAIPEKVPDAPSLGIPEAVLGLGERSQGLLLVVGPTGSGKSTTLACLVDRINQSRNCRIITVEDPIEYVHRSHKATVDQREIHADSMSFAAALKYILRQDPDVILVGEMRDAETISAALTAAETGHLVLSTLHTNDAAQAVDRVVDSFPPHQQAQVRSQLAACLLGVVSQRLLPRADGQGRVPAFEVMIATTGIRTLVRENKMHQAYGLMEAARRDGCVTMDQALQQLFAERKIAYEQAMRHLRNPRSISPEGGISADPGAGAEPAKLPPATTTGDPRRKGPWTR
jgi:twitching motility protein PilT